MTDDREDSDRSLAEVIVELLAAEADIITERIAARRGRGPYEPDGFQEQCLRTWADEGQTRQQQVMHAALGLGGEAGELLDLLKKHFFKPGRTATAESVMDELSDVMYYVAVLAHLWEFTFGDMQAHLAGKLADGHGWIEGVNSSDFNPSPPIKIFAPKF